ncbi:hypothetical protein, variant 1 [Aphanomyces astaci]|uniref:Uncharacterized protein n=1 Tax=Aphanomyces astaci TaxID=112090 RepID=W4G5P8_APHAT|nr:hypothetical protein, variant 1 [Aphanomyces astaci]ETV75037.1 hypothetical protein, variant 1 [Aphanomyces astaci]|eukprot:XP_009835540.1 hypothetical protein, variant 1 [Aphanomyces astaci]
MYDDDDDDAEGNVGDTLHALEATLVQLETKCYLAAIPSSHPKSAETTAWAAVMAEYVDAAATCTRLSQSGAAEICRGDCSQEGDDNDDVGSALLLRMESSLASLAASCTVAQIWDADAPEVVDAIARCFFDLAKLCEATGLVVPAFPDSDDALVVMKDDAPLDNRGGKGTMKPVAIASRIREPRRRRHVEVAIESSSSDSDDEAVAWCADILPRQKRPPPALRSRFTDMATPKK